MTRIGPAPSRAWGDWVFYIADLSSGVFNLWRTNITTDETVLVRHFDNHSAPSTMWNVGGTLLFTTWPGELWRSDGTPSGTTKVRDALVIPDCNMAEDFAVGDGVLYWFAFNNYVPELWRSDGTATGTFRLGVFNGPYADSMHSCVEHDLHFHDGRLYFPGNDDIHGAEPWVSDGTIAGTHLLYDINPGAASSDPAQFITLGGKLYFSATEKNTGRELWEACIDHCPVRQRSVR